MQLALIAGNGKKCVSLVKFGTILVHISKSTGVEEEGVANGKWKKIKANQTC